MGEPQPPAIPPTLVGVRARGGCTNSWEEKISHKRAARLPALKRPLLHVAHCSLASSHPHATSGEPTPPWTCGPPQER
jgi:hypothetical protein